MNTRTVSVVIPAYNATRYLGEALASALAQTAPPLEIIVVNDASPDGTAAFVEEFAKTCPQVRLVSHATNQGISATRNTGLREARGKIIAWLDHDDRWEPDHLASCLETLDREGADLAFSTARMFEDGTNRDLGDLEPIAGELGAMPVSLYQRCFLTSSAFVMRRDVQERIGPFDTHPMVNFAEDYDYFLRSAMAGLRFAHTGCRSCFYRKRHATAATTNMLNLMERQAHVFRKHFGWAAIPLRVRQARLASLHAAIGRLTLFTDPAKSRRYYLLAHRFRPLRLDYLLPAAASFFQPIMRVVRALWRGRRGQKSGQTAVHNTV